MDPVRDAAFRKAEAALEKLQHYGDFEQLRRCLPALAHPSQSVIFVVDAQTSKMPIILQMVDKVKRAGRVAPHQEGRRARACRGAAGRARSRRQQVPVNLVKIFVVVNLSRDLEI